VKAQLILLLLQYLFAFILTYFGYRRLKIEKFSTASKVKFTLATIFSLLVVIFATAVHFNLLK
jgi:hypothetical protein